MQSYLTTLAEPESSMSELRPTSFWAELVGRGLFRFEGGMSSSCWSQNTLSRRRGGQTPSVPGTVVPITPTLRREASTPSGLHVTASSPLHLQTPGHGPEGQWPSRCPIVLAMESRSPCLKPPPVLPSLYLPRGPTLPAALCSGGTAE